MSEFACQIDESVVRGYFERLDPLVKPGTELFLPVGGAYE